MALPIKVSSIVVNARARTRTPNWSVTEKQYLIELIREKKDVVVPKNNNGSNFCAEKSAAWNEIMRKLSEKFGTKFERSTVKKVKTQWQNMKRIAREELAARVISKQSMEVCNILEDIENESISFPTVQAPPELTTSVTIKTEPEEMDESGYSTTNPNISNDESVDSYENGPSASTAGKISKPPISASTEAAPISNDPTYSPASPSSSEFARILEADDGEESNDIIINQIHAKNLPLNLSSTSGFTEPSPPRRFSDQRLSTYEEFASFSAQERKLKIEMLNEEREVLRAMRETHELNKIIAEQRLKLVLRMKKRENTMYSGEPGSGAGRGGGGGGSIREAGGAFGKMEAGREEEYFYRQQKEQIKELKSHLHEEISHHEAEIKRHEAAIRRHKERVSTIDKSPN